MFIINQKLNIIEVLDRALTFQASATSTNISPKNIVDFVLVHLECANIFDWILIVQYHEFLATVE